MRAGAPQKKAASRWRIHLLPLIAVALSIIGCRATPTTPPIAATELLIGGGAYPSGWELCESGTYQAGADSPSLTEGAEEVAFQAFCFDIPTARSGERVYRYWDEGRAARGYGSLERLLFSGNWQLPEELVDVGERAAAWRIGCSDREYRDRTICMFLGRYGPYVVFFSAMTVSEGRQVLAMAELASILAQVDETAGAQRDKEAP